MKPSVDLWFICWQPVQVSRKKKKEKINSNCCFLMGLHVENHLCVLWEEPWRHRMLICNANQWHPSCNGFGVITSDEIWFWWLHKIFASSCIWDHKDLWDRTVEPCWEELELHKVLCSPRTSTVALVACSSGEWDSQLKKTERHDFQSKKKGWKKKLKN